MTRVRRCFLLSATFAAIGTNAMANAAMPLIVFLYPWSGILFVPIVAVEARVLFVRLRVNPWRAISLAFWSNATSTVAGVPLVWYLLSLAQRPNWAGPSFVPDRLLAVTWRAPWFYPYFDEGYWMEPAAIFYFLFPLFVASVVIEALVVAAILRAKPQKHFRTVAVANVWSYLLLAVVVALWAVVRISAHHAG